MYRPRYYGCLLVEGSSSDL